MEKLAAHLGKFGILYIFVALAAGLIVGYNWNTWFPSVPGLNERRGTTSDPVSRCYCNGVPQGTSGTSGQCAKLCAGTL